VKRSLALNRRDGRARASRVPPRSRRRPGQRLGVIDRDEDPQPIGMFGNGRMDDRLDVDAASEKRAGEPKTADRVADDERDHRGTRGDPRIEPALARESQEEARQRVEPCDALRLAAQDRQGGQRRGRVGRGNSNAVDEPGRRVLEILDECRIPRCNRRSSREIWTACPSTRRRCRGRRRRVRRGRGRSCPSFRVNGPRRHRASRGAFP
jgi:hypothetical protein